MFVVWVTLCVAFPVTSLIPRQPAIYQCKSSCRGRCSSETTFKKEETQNISRCFSAKCGHPYSIFKCSRQSAVTNNDILKKEVSIKNDTGTGTTTRSQETRGKNKSQPRVQTKTQQTTTDAVKDTGTGTTTRSQENRRNTKSQPPIQTKTQHTTTDAVKEHKFQADVLIVQGHEGGIFTASLTKNEFATVDTMDLGSKCVDTSLVDFSQGVFYWLCGTSRTKHLHYGTYSGSASGVVFKYKSVKVGHVTGLQADTKANYIFTRQKNTLTRFSLKGKGPLKPKVIFDELEIKLCSLQIFEQKRVIFVYDEPNESLYQFDYSGKQLKNGIYEKMNLGFRLYVKNDKFWIYKCSHGKIITKQVAGKRKRVLYDGTLQCKVIWNYGRHVLVSVKHEIGLWILKNGDLKRVLKDLVTEKQLNILPLKDD